MLKHAHPVVVSWNLAASSLYRALPPDVLDAPAHFYSVARDKIMPNLRATGARRLLLLKPGGVAATDEPSHNDSFRAWSILSSQRRDIAVTMEPALDLLEPLVDELLVYVNDVAASIKALMGDRPDTFFTHVRDCLGPFLAHPKVSVIVGASAMNDPASEAVFQMLRLWRGSGGRKLTVYREGYVRQSRPEQWEDPCYFTAESYAHGQTDGAAGDWPLDLSAAAGEFIMQQPNGALDVAWIDRTVKAGFTAAASLDDMAGMGIAAGVWNRTLPEQREPSA